MNYPSDAALQVVMSQRYCSALGRSLLSALGRSDGSTEMALSDHPISTPGPRWSGIVKLGVI
jgi:hypothetical protein